jgi:hypothetical protein
MNKINYPILKLRTTKQKLVRYDLEKCDIIEYDRARGERKFVELNENALFFAQ